MWRPTSGSLKMCLAPCRTQPHSRPTAELGPCGQASETSPPAPPPLDCRRPPRPLRLAPAMPCVPSPHAACVCCLCEAAALCPPPLPPCVFRKHCGKTYMIELDKFSRPRHVSVSLHEARCQSQTPASRLMRLSAQPQSSMLRTPSRHYGWFQIVSCDRFCGKPFTSCHILHTPLCVGSRDCVPQALFGLMSLKNTLHTQAHVS